MTAVGSTIGTASYLSPEQVTGEPLSPATDMYSFGLVLIECLSGSQAYPGHGIDAALARLQHDPAVPEHVGEAWTRLLTALTRRNPNERPTAVEARDRLRTMSKGVTGESDDTELLGPTAGIAWPTQPAHAAPVGRRWPLLKIAGGLGGLAVVAVVLLAMTSGAGAPPERANSPTMAATSPAPSVSPSTTAGPKTTMPAISVALPSNGASAVPPPDATPSSAKSRRKSNGKAPGKGYGGG